MKNHVAQTKANLARGLNIIATDPARSLNHHIQQGHADLASKLTLSHVRQKLIAF